MTKENVARAKEGLLYELGIFKRLGFSKVRIEALTTALEIIEAYEQQEKQLTDYKRALEKIADNKMEYEYSDELVEIAQQALENDE